MFGLNSRQLIGLVIFTLLLFAASQYVPPYVNAFQFNDFIRQEVKFAAPSRRTIEDVRTAVVQKAKEFNIALNPRDVKITRRGPSFTLNLEYRFPIDLRVYQHELVFQANESGEAFEQR
jgi:hypothetical protein